MRKTLLLLLLVMPAALGLEARSPQWTAGDNQIDRESGDVRAYAWEGRWRGPDGGFLPFTGDVEVVAFLRDAEVVKSKALSQGINRPLKVRLRKDGVEANAIFRTVNDRRQWHVIEGQVYFEFHDSYIYECAAYEVNRLLGLDNVPPCVPRKVNGRDGTMQLWIEDAMTEEMRRRARKEPPSAMDWVRQQQARRLFDALIYNFDRNQGNLLIDEDWNVWLIDHTRSFHKSGYIEGLDRILWCERAVWDKLRALDRETLERRIGGLVEEQRISRLLERRDVLVKHLEDRVLRIPEDRHR